jgi:RimJ/RimL family protein N-acetyltransferase
MHLETKRLILRKPEPRDVESYLEFVNSEFVMRYNAMSPVTREKVERQFAEAPDDGSVIALEEKASGRLLGMVYSGEDSLRYGIASKEFSYFLREDAARQGYMKEALSALIAHFFESENLDLVSARCFAPNTASRRLLESLGFRQDGLVRRCVKGYRDVVFDDCLYSLLREDFMK